MEIRNIGIIAHVDHGKSTLADRMLEVCGVVDARKARPQLLDMMELERERGITIKMQPVQLPWQHPESGAAVVIHLIDTPGHIDFSYEVSRALKAVEGVVLLVDASQGIEAQTLAVLEAAREEGLTIIPALSKVDLPTARVGEMRDALARLLAIDPKEVLLTSGKTGEGVVELLNTIVRRVPPPHASLQKEGASGQPRALIFDFQYSDHQGVILFVRVFEGEFRKGQELQLLAGGVSFSASEVGIFTPERQPQAVLTEGGIGYIITGIKEPGIARIGDTVALAASRNVPPLKGFREPQPMVWASLYPESQDDFDHLRQALTRIRLTDAAVQYEEETSGILGRGFRVGFLGMLHLEIILERLKREFNVSLTVTQPSLEYEVELRTGQRRLVRTAAHFPHYGEVARVFEPWVRATVITPPEHLDALMPLWHEFEATMTDLAEFSDGRLAVEVELPLRELMRGLHDRIKSVSSGFASLSYVPLGMREGHLTRLDVLLADEEVPALARVVPVRRLEEEARRLVARLKEVLPRQLFVLKIQARALGRIVASERLPALRKDVTGHLYGGDVTRKRKLLEKQKKGKKRLLQHARVRIPPEVMHALLRDR